MRRTREGVPGEDAGTGYATRSPESATFATTRVGGGRRPPVFAAAFVLVVGGMVVIGIAGRAPADPPAMAGTSIEQGGGGASPSAPVLTIAPSPDRAPVVTNGDGPIVLQARRHPETVYVHGDVFVDRVTWVFVSVQDAAGRIAGWASVSIPASAMPAASDVPTLRFDVELALPPAAADGLLRIHASAHDADGRLVATARVEMDAEGNAVGAAIRPVARPGVFFPRLDASWEDPR
jgi:hypothetical protein